MKLIKKYFIGSSIYFNDDLNSDNLGILPQVFFAPVSEPNFPGKNNNIRNNKKYDFSSIAKEAGKSMFNNLNLNIAANYFLEKGYSLEQTAALLANAFYESGGLNNEMMLNKNGTYKGGWQWHLSLENAGHFKSSDLMSQLLYLHLDLKRNWALKGVKYKEGTLKGKLESHNGWIPKYKKLWEKGGSAAQLAKIFSIGYERHNNSKQDMLRSKLATSIYNLLNK